MIQPPELRKELPMKLSRGAISTTTKVWAILKASHEGNLDQVKSLVDECAELCYAQYNYTPPIHFAVREGHIPLVKYLLQIGAHDPGYRIYPFLENLVVIAQDRGYLEIVEMLQAYAKDESLEKYGGDNGEIMYDRSPSMLDFQKAVDKGMVSKVAEYLKDHPEYALDETLFWGEGIMLMPAKEGNYEMLDLLMSYGARVPSIIKWGQFYYFETYKHAAYLMEKGMNPNVMSWHRVTLLHDMAQKGEIRKAELLIKYGAEINSLEEEYCSTPLGMAARWGHGAMVNYLLSQGADPNKSAAAWSTPLAWARAKGHNEIEKLLMQAGGK